ncbi:hypothetical protein J3F84DRAFT_50017 [Trichoderma pleuroticola]
MAVLRHAGSPNASDQSDQRDNRQPALYWPGPQSTTPLMLMPATSPWFPRDPTSFVSPYAVEPWLRYVSPVLLVAESTRRRPYRRVLFQHQTNTAPMSCLGVLACLFLVIERQLALRPWLSMVNYGVPC